MDIVHIGHSSFKISGKAASVVTDPFTTQSTGLKYPNISATIVTVSHHHGDHDSVDQVSGVKKVFDKPGEYEVEGISIIGIQSFHDDKSGAERGNNTIFVFEIDGFRVCHLGDLGHKLSEEQVNAIGDIDILLIPIGGVYTIDSKTAVEVVQSIEPRIVIPMHYKVSGMNDSMFGGLSEVGTFINEIGLKAKQESKLNLKAGSILPDDLQLVVLDSK